jgi:hypothetical protein
MSRKQIALDTFDAWMDWDNGLCKEVTFDCFAHIRRDPSKGIAEAVVSGLDEKD